MNHPKNIGPTAFKTTVKLAESRWLATPADPAATEAMTRGGRAEELPDWAARCLGQIKLVETFPYFQAIHLQPEGVIVAAADDDVEPVLAFSEQRDFE